MIGFLYGGVGCTAEMIYWVKERNRRAKMIFYT